MLLSHLSSDAFISAVHREGTINTDVGDLVIRAVLFDSGALSASYLSQSFYGLHREQLEPYTSSVRGFVKLAAKETVVPISQCALLTITFIDTNNNTHSARVQFYILPESNNNMVIGLPAIIMHFGTLFIDMLQSAVQEYTEEPSHNLTNITHDLINPWLNAAEGESPEEAAEPHPCIFTDVLHFLEITPEAAREEYFAQMDDHVSEPFRKAVPIIEYLCSPQAVPSATLAADQPV